MYFGKCRLFSYNLFAAIRINIGHKLDVVRLFELHEICVLLRKHYICSLSHGFISTLAEVKGLFSQVLLLPCSL
jgi:hypothetical protein